MIPLLAAFIFLTTVQEIGVLERGPYPTFADCQVARPAQDQPYLGTLEVGVSECFEPPPGNHPWQPRAQALPNL